MSEMRSLNGPSGSQSRLSGRSLSSILEIDSWMPSKLEAIPPLVNRLMLLIEGSQCVPGEEFVVELALREALRNAVVHGKRDYPRVKVHIRCRCWPGKEVSIVVASPGKGFDFVNTGDGLISDPSEHARGMQLISAYMDEVHFERDGSELHMRKRSRTTVRS
jgi:serine/threonine-protein kinase RsbW